MIAKKTVLVLVVALGAAVPAFAQDACSNASVETALKTQKATASAYANFRNAEGSLRFEVNRLLEEGEKSAKGKQGECPQQCPLSSVKTVFKAVPSKFLAKYSESAACEALLARTKNAPFVYEKAFQDREKFTEWFMDFSSGKGKDGGDLYERCPGMCSPQYNTVLENRGAALASRAEVVCGPARDKGDNMYNLSLSLRRSCAK